MVRITCVDKTDFHSGINSWDDYETKAVDPLIIMNEYASNELRVFDCDSGGDYTYDFGIKINNEYFWFEVHHDFWANRDDEGFYVENSFEIKAIGKPETVALDRNWYNPRSRSYPLRTTWPPENLESYVRGSMSIDKIS